MPQNWFLPLYDLNLLPELEAIEESQMRVIKDVLIGMPKSDLLGTAHDGCST